MKKKERDFRCNGQKKGHKCNQLLFRYNINGDEVTIVTKCHSCNSFSIFTIKLTKKTMEVKNIYHKRLSFEILGRSVGINPNEVINVDDEIGKEMLKSPWITANLKSKCAECSQKPKIDTISAKVRKELPDEKAMAVEKKEGIKENKNIESKKSKINNLNQN